LAAAGLQRGSRSSSRQADDCPDEIDSSKGCISTDQPLARAALKNRADDEFEAALPAGLLRFAVLKVS
jgi:transcription elongation factor GreB